MQAPVKHKDVEISGRKFRIRKFPARSGSFILIKLTTILMPIFTSLMPLFKSGLMKDEKEGSFEDFKVDDKVISTVMSHLGNISEQDFTYIQEQALKVCYESLSAGLAPVLNDNGTFGVEDLEDDTMLVMGLTIHALVFNLTSFFQGSGLGGIVPGLTSSQQG
ncbi:phage tail assembly chaperone [Brevibacillus sp. SIMBA_040]|uniref:phage tail assembly chaperone n=1 Tax=unclassified Brevibacillus TaxID=2684853 RepID=UPI00397ADB05